MRYCSTSTNPGSRHRHHVGGKASRPLDPRNPDATTDRRPDRQRRPLQWSTLLQSPRRALEGVGADHADHVEERRHRSWNLPLKAGNAGSDQSQLAMLFEQIGLNKRESKDMIDAFFDLVSDSWSKRRLKISGFGNFQIRTKAPRPGRNPRTGEAIRLRRAAS